ncbi:hypothetical protein HDU87_000649 [Geranomyces variabilis]|uniref:Uncharacterized protein n=1 Tax=Geranomyces variabilis TaxID=109894 RepID=A0AAD5XJC8_9FUNG|nr:hypothetical protein HDU87_000649 [Geranomyces variabilis]
MSTRTSLRASSKTSASTVAGSPTLTLETVALLKGDGLKLAGKQAGIHPVPKKVGDQRKALREHLSGNAAEAGLMEQLGHPGLDGGQRRPMTDEEIRIAASCPRLPPEIIQHIFTGPVLDELAAVRYDAWESQALAKVPHFSSKHLPFSNILRQACRGFNKQVLDLIATARRQSFQVSWDAASGLPSVAAAALRTAFSLQTSPPSSPQGSSTQPPPLEAILAAAPNVRRLSVEGALDNLLWELAPRLCPGVLTLKLPSCNLFGLHSTAIQSALHTWHHAGFGGLRNIHLSSFGGGIDEQQADLLTSLCPRLVTLGGVHRLSFGHGNAKVPKQSRRLTLQKILRACPDLKELTITEAEDDPPDIYSGLDALLSGHCPHLRNLRLNKGAGRENGFAKFDSLLRMPRLADVSILDYNLTTAQLVSLFRVPEGGNRRVCVSPSVHPVVVLDFIEALHAEISATLSDRGRVGLLPVSTGGRTHLTLYWDWDEEVYEEIEAALVDLHSTAAAGGCKFSNYVPDDRDWSNRDERSQVQIWLG